MCGNCWHNAQKMKHSIYWKSVLCVLIRSLIELLPVSWHKTVRTCEKERQDEEEVAGTKQYCAHSPSYLFEMYLQAVTVSAKTLVSLSLLVRLNVRLLL